MAKKSVVEAGPFVWTVAELGAFYTEHRSELLSHAHRVLKDSAKAEEITQEALIKFMLAAPELESNEHGLSYLHRTIENLCIDLFRMEGRRPNLVVLDDASAEIEAAWQDNGDHSLAMSAAEDAAIIRQALALLSPAERAALVMWEVEGRSTDEIAAELGIKTSAVRHTLSRARASLRRILSELVIDEERGLTALDLLSTTYKKAGAVAKKSSKVALSLILVLFGFFGFNSISDNNAKLAIDTPIEIAVGPISGATSNSTLPSPLPTSTTSPANSPSPQVAAASQTPSISIATSVSAPKKAVSTSDGAAIKGARISFAGLDQDGLPTGFSITDSNNKVGKLFVSRDAPILTDGGLTLRNTAMTSSGGPNVLISQTITVDGSGTSYEATIAAGINGNWAQLNLTATSVNTERLANGQYLMTVTFIIDSATSSDFLLATYGSGYDLIAAPKAITTRLLLTPGKTQILAQAVAVSELRKGVTA